MSQSEEELKKAVKEAKENYNKINKSPKRSILDYLGLTINKDIESCSLNLLDSQGAIVDTLHYSRRLSRSLAVGIFMEYAEKKLKGIPKKQQTDQLLEKVAMLSFERIKK